MYSRNSVISIREALADTPVVSINGPRQSGKTTLAQQLVNSDWSFHSLDDENTLVSARNDPSGFIKRLDRAIIDEVHRVPELMFAIKYSVDMDDRPGRFLLTGSTYILRHPKIKESLAGRMEIVPLYPLSCSEINGLGIPKFLSLLFQGNPPDNCDAVTSNDLIDIVTSGGYPRALSKSSEGRRRKWHRTYISSLLENDATDISAFESINGIGRLAEILAQYSGQLTNFSEIANNTKTSGKTVSRHTNLLEHLYVVSRIDPWFRNGLNRLIKTPKLHFIDSGLLTTLKGYNSARIKRDRSLFGSILETFVYSELLKQINWSQSYVSLYHYRDKDNNEIDFVLESDSGYLVGIEVKASSTIKSEDFRGLRKLFAIDPDNFRIGIVLYDGDQTLPFGDRMYAVPVSSIWQ